MALENGVVRPAAISDTDAQLLSILEARDISTVGV